MTTNVPGPLYWADETSNVLRPVVMRLLDGEALSPQDCAVMRAYLRQWIMAPVWDLNPHGGHDALFDLRSRLEGLTTRAAIALWLDDAAEQGLDPL